MIKVLNLALLFFLPKQYIQHTEPKNFIKYTKFYVFLYVFRLFFALLYRLHLLLQPPLKERS